MRPDIIHVGGILYWTIQTRNPDTQLLTDADSTPTVAVRKNGASVGDSVTITKRSATTGLYDCSYNPAAEVEGDTFQFEESATVTGTTTSSATYVNQFSVRAVHAGAVELDSASIMAIYNTMPDAGFTDGSFGDRWLISSGNQRTVQITGSNHIAADVHEFQAGVITSGDFAADSITASALATDAVTEIQSGLATSAALATESGKITNIENASGYVLAVLAGACADPQTASETYAITVFGSTFTVDMAGQTSTGTRTAPTLTKT